MGYVAKAFYTFAFNQLQSPIDNCSSSRTVARVAAEFGEKSWTFGTYRSSQWIIAPRLYTMDPHVVSTRSSFDIVIVLSFLHDICPSSLIFRWFETIKRAFNGEGGVREQMKMM